ncbi:MAG: UDP-N-acetylmuramate dehydrogenase, partial [Vicinamibacterales bacterium]
MMTTGEFEGQLSAIFGDRLRRNAPLAPLTTFKVGGPADYLLLVQTADELVRAVQFAHTAGLRVTMLGGGSNVLISDQGIRGLVIRLRGTAVSRLDANHIRAEAALTMNGLVRWTINRGVAGLEAWAGTPGTVGGAVYGNAHFQGRNIGELVERVTLVDSQGQVKVVPASEMEFGYDVSRLQRTREIAVSVDFRVSDGDPSALRATARESLAFRKRTQPLESASAGCIFQNPDPSRDPVPAGIPASAGALVDRAGLKGSREGHASVSTTHANFIVNEGSAMAK